MASAAGISHILVGDGATDAPRLGESLNAEGNLEIARQFPELERFFFRKDQVALFFGDNALSFGSLQYAGGPAYYRLLGYPPTVQLLHVDRIGFDRALFQNAVADDHCLETLVANVEALLLRQERSLATSAAILGVGKTLVSLLDQGEAPPVEDDPSCKAIDVMDRDARGSACGERRDPLRAVRRGIAPRKPLHPPKSHRRGTPPSCLLLLSAPTLAASIDAEDVRIIDGDTIRIYQKQPNVRLVGFNAPETRRAACEAERELGAKATRRLRIFRRPL